MIIREPRRHPAPSMSGNASEESTHALNAETGKADLSQSERAAMRANIDYQTTTVIKEE